LTPFGVYVHVPFCRERCDYCAFATYTDRDHLMERYAEACVSEVTRAVAAGRLVAASSPTSSAASSRPCRSGPGRR